MPDINFNRKMSIKEFKEKYWYKTDLQQICQKIGLPTYGTKYELSEYICRFLSGEDISKIKPYRKRRRKMKLSSSEITPNTKILASGFSLNQKARGFFSKYYGVEKFSFNKAMGIKMREIEAVQDKTATVKDLIEAYENLDKVEAKEDKTYQWNNFIKDFNADQISKKYKSKIKVAAILWQKVKQSTVDKKYSRRLLVDNQESIKSYLKK